jgi:NADPH-dependent F420 reductase
MQVALVGGTGDLGEGLLLRLACDTDHSLVVGSRDAEKAERAVSDYESELADRGVERSIRGADNTSAVQGSDVVFLTVPPYYTGDTVESIADELGPETIVVSPVVGMSGDEDGLHYNPPSSGSNAALVRETVPDDVPVVGACTNLPAGALADLDEPIDVDTFVFGDDDESKATVSDVVGRIEGVRCLNVGPLANAKVVESLTPLLINLARYNDDLEDACVKIR